MMKTNLFFILLFFSSVIFAQVGIGTSNPNTSSILDIVSSSKGVLMPRMTQAQRDNINPGTADTNRDGLLIYNTDTNCYNYWNIAQANWMSLCQTATICDPSTFADFTINCSQFPTADTNNYTIGQNTSGSITFSVNVIKIGPYSLQITDNAGITYTHNGNFTTTGIQPVTVTGGGIPSGTPIIFYIKANGITTNCTYQKTATSTFSVTYTCGNSTPAQSSIPFTIGTNTNGTFTIPMTVTGTGNIPSQTFSSNGITFSTVAISNANSTNNNLTINYTGTPTSNLISFGIGSCTYQFTAATAFSYNFNCNTGVIISPQMVRGVNKSGTVTVPITVTGTGNIPAINQTVSGVTYTFAGIANATSAITSININYSGAPNTDNSLVTITNSNGTTCNIPISHPYGNAVYSCNGTPVVAGSYIVETNLTSGNFIKLKLNVTVPGYANFSSNNLNGIQFKLDNYLIDNVGTSVEVDVPAVLKDPITDAALFPLDSEQAIQVSGTYNNGGYISVDEYTIGSCSPARLDVKPKVISGASITMDGNASQSNSWPSNGAAYASDGTHASKLPKDSRISLDIRNIYNQVVGIGYQAIWYTYIKNLTTSQLTNVSFNSQGSADTGTTKDTNWVVTGKTINPSIRYGSIDPYIFGMIAPRPSTSVSDNSTDGSWGVGNNGVGTTYVEVNSFGFSFLYNSKYYKYRVIFDGNNGSTALTHLILISISDAAKTVYVPETVYTIDGVGNANERNPIFYNP